MRVLEDVVLGINFRPIREEETPKTTRYIIHTLGRFRVISSRMIKWSGNVACIRETRNVSVREPEGKRLFEDLSVREMILKRISKKREYERGQRIHRLNMKE